MTDRIRAAASLLVLLLAPASLARAAEPAAGSEAPAAADVAFGEEFKLGDDAAIPVARVLADPAAWSGKYVRLAGRVDKVCSRRGCWMTLSAPGAKDSLYVKFTCPIQGRLIPAEAAGREAVVEGTVAVREIPEQDARHVREEGGATKEELEAIRGPQKEVHLAAPAALVRGLPSPPRGE